MEGEDIKELDIKAIIGFDGRNNRGLIAHPDGRHLVYGLGNKVVILDFSTKKQSFLAGHTNNVSSVALSKSGKYIGSGQINHIGFRALVILWDFKKQEILAKHESHKVRVENVTFSQDDGFMLSLGGRDCGQVIVWDIEAMCLLGCSQVARGVQGDAVIMQSMTKRGPCFATGGENHIAIWTIYKAARNIQGVYINLGKLKRNIICMNNNERDEFLYCGTSTGDVLKVGLNFYHDVDILAPSKDPTLIGCFAKLTKKKLPRGCVDLYQNGVRSIKVLPTGALIIGAGDGTVELVQEHKGKLPQHDPNVKLPSIPVLKVLKSTNINGAVTSLEFLDGNTLLAATSNSEVFLIYMNEFCGLLVVTCHTSAIYSVAFPHNFSDVFATGGKHDVRIWSTSTMQELLRVKVQNFNCSSIQFSHDGKSIITGWSDGTIRAFTPLTGRLIYVILDAHNKGVSALAVSSHGRILISGGCEGQVRLWSITPTKQTLVCTLKEHKGPISAIDINKFNTEAASSSSDGSCIIWDLERQCRRQILFSSTLFMCVKYFPTSVQILTAGSDRKIGYWEVIDGTLVRELEASPSGAINAIDISPDGELIVSGGNDQIVKLWRYQEGITTHFGYGHAAVITAAMFSPDCKLIITCDAVGSIFVWKVPESKSLPEKEIVQEVKQEVGPIDLNGKEENIVDLPTVRSQASAAGGETMRSASSHDSCCKCSSKASSRSESKTSFKSQCSKTGAGDALKTSARSNASQKSKRSGN